MSLTPAQLHLMDLMLGPTDHPIDRQRIVVVLTWARFAGVQDDVVEYLLMRRREYKAWVFRTQRKWQAHTRRPSRARHHDSVEIREKHVRCAT